MERLVCVRLWWETTDPDTPRLRWRTKCGGEGASLPRSQLDEAVSYRKSFPDEKVLCVCLSGYEMI